MRTFDILLPIYDAFAEVRQCLASLVKHTDPRHKIYLLDDHSPDENLVWYLENFCSAHPQFILVRGTTNQGFLRNVNSGLKLTTHDVVLLNSDTLVGKDWLIRMEKALDSRANVGIVSPLFSCAYFLSFPYNLRANRIPKGYTLDSFTERLAELSPRNYPEVPAGLGCCMLITREVLHAVGYLDECFSPGYWEDVDYSMKAREKGFRIVCADDVFIFHHSGMSFGHNEERKRLVGRNETMAHAFWPTFKAEVDCFSRQEPFKEHRARLGLKPSL